MAIHLVSYELRAPGRDYGRLIARLIELGGVRALESLWLLPSAAKPSDLRDELTALMDPNDRLLVICVRRNAAWRRLVITRREMKSVLQSSRLQ